MLPFRASYPVSSGERVNWHLGTYNERKITVATYRCDDGKFCIEGVRVDVRKDGKIVGVDMPYMGIVDADEQTVVQKAMIDAVAYAQRRY